MPTPPRSDEQCSEVAETYLGLFRNGLPPKIKEVADALGLEWSTAKRTLADAASRGLLGTSPVLPSFRISKVSTVLDENGETVREFVQQRPEAGGPFNLPDGHRIKGISALLDGQGNVQSQWVKTRADEIDPMALIEGVKVAFEGWEPPEYEEPSPTTTDSDLLTVYGIADLHLGLKAVADESGADFDLGIAARRFRDTTKRLFDRSPNSGTALILELGDFFHVDDDLALTPTSKHTLQVSDRLLDIVRVGVEIMSDYIHHALSKHQRVVVKCLKGNHNLNSWIALYMGLSQRFRGNDRVTIDGGSADYWFFRWGSTLIGAHHGHRLRPEEMAGAMATECRQDWGETDYRLFLHGHLHHMMVKEVLGVRVECLRTIAEVDQHHSGKYASGKSLVSITIHKENGEDGRAQINLPPVKRRASR